MTDPGPSTAHGRAQHGATTVALVLGGLVVASTLIRFAAAQAFTTPWIAPDEMVYGMLGETLWSNGTLTLRELSSPYYSLLTPALVGAPLAALDLEDGIQWARLLQALAMSLVAVPTYLWARRLASTWWAVAAAVLVLAAPAFHYSGLLMTEPLTLTVVTAALLALARALQEPSTWRYGVFAAWATAAAAVRLQALVLLPTFLLAALVDAAAARDRARLRPLVGLGVAAVGVSAAVAAAVVLTGGELSSRRLLGAYTPVGEAAAASGRLAEILWHAFGVAVLGLGVTVLATAALAFRSLSGRDRDPALRAFASVALAYLVLLVIQVGLFSATFVGSVAERYLVTTLPLLAIGLCAWISRGAPRAPVAVVPVWAAMTAGAALVPLSQIAAPETLPNTPTPAWLAALGSDGRARAALVVAALVAGALVLFVPRRLAWVTALVVLLGLGAVSVDSGRRIADASEHEQRAAVGSASPAWIEEAGLDGATLLLSGDRLWTASARTLFWNRGIDDAVRLAGLDVPFPPATPEVEIAPDGSVRVAGGSPLERPLVVASSTLTLAGEKVAERPAGDSETYGLAAWRSEGPVRVLRRTEGFLPNGDFGGTATVTVYGCEQGTLDVTILGKTGDPIVASVDGIVVERLETPAEQAVTHSVPAPPYADGSGTCTFALANENGGYAGSTTIGFTPR